MKKTIKVWSFLLATLLMVLPLAGCGGTASSRDESSQQTPSSSQPDASLPEAEKTQINVIGLKGPTALGMLQVMEKNEAGEAANDYTISLAGAPDEITGKLISGEVDIAAVPTNLASVLYNKTEGGVKLLALGGAAC